MKKISLSLTALVLSLATVNTSSAQSNALYASSIVVMNNSNTNPGTENSGIDARAIKNFKKDFSTISNAQWEQRADGFESKFEQKNIQFKIGYNQKGDWQYTERTYSVNNLPIDVKHNIDITYLNYDITLVEEITTRQRTVYIVHIDNLEYSMKIKVDGDEMETMETYKK